SATQILSLILGGGASSRLFQKVREKRGLVYTISSMHSGFSDAGLFQIYAGTDPKRLKELVPVICEEIRGVKKRVTPGELSRAKAQVRADLLMGKESVMRRAEIAGNQLLAFGKPILPEKIIQRVSAITSDDVEKAAARLFSSKLILTTLGPSDELDDYKRISERLGHD
ncbi:MAG: insulinase family protein, partial [Alphaproteobacteria bacterium]|nr:insulinase family protein [Alphaproteobacteria bacterium]